LEWKSDSLNNWLCIAATGGLTLRNTKSNVAKEYVYDPLNPSSLQAFTVYHLTKDKQDRLWLSTDNGINIVDPNLQNFENIAVYQQLNLKNPKEFGLPTNILATENEFLVTSFYRHGLYVFNKDWRLIKHVARIPEDSKSERSENINNIYKDASGDFWFSTDSGLVKKHGNRYQFFFTPRIDPINEDEYAISKIYKRADGLFWIRARKKGIYLFDPVQGKFIARYEPNGTDIIGPVYSCFLDPQSTLWVGASNSISRYVAEDKKFKKITVKNEDSNICEVTWVTDITQDAENVIWAVSDKGLLKINKEKDEGVLMTQRSGLPENYLKRLMIDTAGQLWITSRQGIIKYDRKRTFTFFNINNGLPVEYEGHGFFDFDGNGHLLMGSSGFVTKFNPYQIKTNLAEPELVLMDLLADGKPVDMVVENGKRTITLKPGTNILNLHFTITNYTAPNENTYYYKLGDAEGAWQQVKNGDLALGSLPTGSYSLFIKGSNNDDVYSKIEQVTINVLPHWYETMLFYVLLGSLIVSLTIYFVRRRIATIRRESMLKQQLAESELKAIRAQMNPHFIYNVLNSIESYILEKDAQSASALVQKFANLSRLILENSTQSLVPVSREWRALELYTDLEAMRFENIFRYEFINRSSIDLNKLMVPPMLVQPLIENAIHHGLRNSLNRDSLVSIELTTTDNHVIFKVSDNGVGLSATINKKGGHLFKQQSLGLKTIEERVVAINALSRSNSASFSIREIVAENKSGTEAILTLRNEMCPRFEINHK
jgi:sugar lactone lactonase YvrE